jgi:hypothetical protein
LLFCVLLKFILIHVPIPETETTTTVKPETRRNRLNSRIETENPIQGQPRRPRQSTLRRTIMKQHDGSILVLTPTGSTNLSMNSLPPRENKPLPKLPPTEITVSKQEVEKVEIKTTEVVKKLITLDLSKTTEKRDDKKDQLEGSKPKEEVKVSPRKPDTAFGKLMNFIAPRSPRPEDKSPTPTPEKAKPRLAIVGVTSLIRNVVSKNKKRFQQDGFDLDLSYITPQIVAMGYPSSGFESNYRNPAKEVVRLLETKHKDKYKIYNLCEEKQYDPSTFFSRVESFGFKDHNAPPLAIMRP